MRKGQAALEFLTTYGWAFLVILVMIGALAYFGVLNPRGLLPSRCTFSPEIYCLEHQTLSSTNVLNFRMRNDVGSSATYWVNSTYLGGDNPSVICSTTTTMPVGPGKIAEYTCNFNAVASFTEGDAAKFAINVVYLKSDGKYNQTTTGEIYGTVN